MTFDKLLTAYRLQDTAEQGTMPKERLVKTFREWYGERNIGVTRTYAALGANRSVDLLARIWRNDEILPGDYIIPEDGNQYRVDFITHTKDEDGLEVSDLTLVRLEALYDVAE